MLQSLFLFNKEYIRQSESAFSKSLIENPQTTRLAAWNWNRIEGYFVDKKFANTLDLKKVETCFKAIKNKNSNNELFSFWGSNFQIEKTFPLESGFCKRVFQRYHEETQKIMGNPYSKKTKEGRIKRKLWNEYLMYKKLSNSEEYNNEMKKTLIEREFQALKVIERKLQDPSPFKEPLTAVAHMESKEIEIKTKETKTLCILFVGLTAISTFATLYYYNINSKS